MCQLPESNTPDNAISDQLYDAARRGVIYATAVGEVIGGLRAMQYVDDAKSLQAISARLLQGLNDRLEELEAL